MSANQVEQSTIHLIAEFEGCILHPYKDAVGIWTIGYGATLDLNGHTVTAKTSPITLAQADQLLVKQLQRYANTVNEVIKPRLTQNQFDACVSLCYNIGQGGFATSSVARFINATPYPIYGVTKFPDAAKAFLLWDKAGGKLNAQLLARRQAEMELFLS